MFAKTAGTPINQVASTGVEHAQHGLQSTAQGAWHFTRHFFEMCAAMCIGHAALNPVYLWGMGQLGYSDAFVQLPELSVLAVAVNMTVPMAAWMRFRGMKWRLNAEMSAAMFVEAMMVIVANWLGIIPQGNPVSLMMGLMMPFMLIPMLLRLNAYTGRSCH